MEGCLLAADACRSSCSFLRCSLSRSKWGPWLPLLPCNVKGCHGSMTGDTTVQSAKKRDQYIRSIMQQYNAAEVARKPSLVFSLCILVYENFPGRKDIHLLRCLPRRCPGLLDLRLLLRGHWQRPHRDCLSTGSLSACFENTGLFELHRYDPLHCHRTVVVRRCCHPHSACAAAIVRQILELELSTSTLLFWLLWTPIQAWLQQGGL